LLGIEGGGTRTVAVMADETGRLIHRVESGPANLRLLSDPQLGRHFRSIAAQFPKPAALGIGLAGVRTGADVTRVQKLAAQVWPGIPCQATDDLETALAAAETQKAEGRRQKKDGRARHVPAVRFRPSAVASVLVLSGTGSCCCGTNAKGRTAKVGGWGHLLGDAGSAYQIGLNALKAVAAAHDHSGHWPKLGETILRSLLLNEPEALIDWAPRASKTEIAALAVDVFDAWSRKDKIATSIIAAATESLAADAAACAERLATRGAPVRFVLAGGTLLKQPRFAALVRRRLGRLWPRADVITLEREGAWGAIELARRLLGKTAMADRLLILPARAGLVTPMLPFVRSVRMSPTEQRNPRSMKLDKLSIAKAIRLMLAEDTRIPQALRRKLRQIEQAIRMVVASFRHGGRLFYVGAGTSGRLGVLDASECPPTFRTPPERVQAIIAGNQTALWRAVEGTEDDSAAGARAIQFRGVNSRDIVVGIAASGRTPFVWGALLEAKRRRARTILVCFNPFLRTSRAARPDLIIAPNVGPELLTGSTRLKAGTATKLLLNILTTLAMVELGKVAGNLMVDLNPTNVKLRNRAVRIVQELTGVDFAAAQAALEQSAWVVKRAVAKSWPPGSHRTA